MSLENMERLIPHRGLMKSIDELVSFDSGGGEIRLVLDPSKPYFYQGEFETLFTVELMAQSIAAVYGYSARKDKHPRIGYLISIDSYELLNFVRLEPGNELRIVVRLEHNAEPIGVYQAECFFEKILISRSQMKVFLTDRRIQ